MKNMSFEKTEFERDRKTGALINVDLKEYNKYKETKSQYKRMNNFEKEVSEIKNMLGKILDRIEKNGD